MFWRSRPSSHSPLPSPQRTVDGITEMDRYVCPLDSDTPDPTIGSIDGVSAPLPKDNQPEVHNSQNSGDDQTACSDNEPTLNLAQPPATITKDDAKPSAVPNVENDDTPKARKTSSVRSKAQRSRPQFFTLLACLSYLLFHLLGLNLGLRLINDYTMPRLNQAEIQLQVALRDLNRDQITHKKLDILLETKMDRQYLESYETCLARGLHQAEKIFLGSDFTFFPDVRTQTMDWVTDNCDRLLYTPQVHTLNASRLRLLAQNVRTTAEKTLALLRYRAALLRCKIRGIRPQVTRPHSILQSSPHTTASSKPSVHMPLCFSLDCEGRVRCRLVHSGLCLSATDMKTAREAASEAGKEVSKWVYPFKRLIDINGCLISVLAMLQLLLSMSCMVTVHLSHSSLQPQALLASRASRTECAWPRFCKNITSLKPEEKLAVGLVINTALYALLHYKLAFITSEFDRFLLPAGLGFCAFHLPQALAFLHPAAGADESLHRFCRAMYEIRLINLDADSLPDSMRKQQKPSAGPLLLKCCNTRPASKIGARFISPLTPISEDLQQERRALHEEQGRQPHDDFDPYYGYATETDSEYESDVQHASCVDLTGGTGTLVSEDEDEWSVVEH